MLSIDRCERATTRVLAKPRSRMTIMFAERPTGVLLMYAFLFLERVNP
jgi:hypothetical protein